MNEVFYRAAWGTPLKVMTLLTIGICAAISVPGILVGMGEGARLSGWGFNSIPRWTGWAMALVPFATVVGCAVFGVRGYLLTDTSLIILRPGWRTEFKLVQLVSATIDPAALKGSLRVFGNGGVFAFTGWFRNSKYGVYRLFSTDAQKSVVLKFADRTVIISPSDPEALADEIMPRVARLRAMG